MLAALIGWGLAGLLTARAGGSWWLGVVVALWSGMVSALMVAAAEVASTLLALPQLAQHELSNPDYLYWGQPDIQSYAHRLRLRVGNDGADPDSDRGQRRGNSRRLAWQDGWPCRGA